MKIDGANIPISVETYIWLIKHIYKINVVKNKYINDDASPYDILGYMLFNRIQDDKAFNRYISREYIKYHGKELLGTLDTNEIIKNQAIVNGKVLNDLYYTKSELIYNQEILSLIHKAIVVLINNKRMFNDKEVLRNIEILSIEHIFNLYNNRLNIDDLERKYFNSPLYDTVIICRMILDSNVRRQEKDSESYINECTLVSIRHLIEKALRIEIRRGVHSKKIEVLKDELYGGETTYDSETDITVLGDKITIFEIKTGRLTRDKRSNWAGQTYRYICESAGKYNKNLTDINGIILYLYGQKADSKNEHFVTDFNTMEDIIKLDKGRVSLLSLDMSQHDPAIIEAQIKHIGNLLREYNNVA